MSALKWYHVDNGAFDRWTLADADADSDWVRDRGLVELHILSDGWHADAHLYASGPATEPFLREEVVRVLKQRLRELLNRLETEEVVP